MQNMPTQTPQSPAGVRLVLPANTDALASIHALLRVQAQQHHFSESAQTHMSTAAEEALSTILRLSKDDANDISLELEVHIEVDDQALKLRLSDQGMPYDSSLIPEYCPTQPDHAHDDEAGLSAFLMHKLADACEVHNWGHQGHHVLLLWLLPMSTATNDGEDEGENADVAGAADIADAPEALAQAPQAAESIATYTRPFQDSDAIHLARLLYRSYGYSYTNPDLYIADNIRARIADGRMTSWVAVVQGDESNTPVGHIAFLKAHRDDDTMEVGAAVVSPSLRSSGVLGQLLATAAAAVVKRPERAAFVYAVAAHPYSQKMFAKVGCIPSALLLGFMPPTVQYRSIAGHAASQRGSVFYTCKLLRPADPVKVFLPAIWEPMLTQFAAGIGLPLLPQADANMALSGKTDIHVRVRDTLNSAFLTLKHAGQDLEQVLPKLLRQLCRQQLDVMYLSLDLSDAAAPQVCAAATALGFIPAGLTPFRPWPATLCLQYLNNQWQDPAGISAVGPVAEALRDVVFEQYRRVEHLD